MRARIDVRTKQKADEIFRRVGVSSSAVIRALFLSVAASGRLPSSLNIPNNETAKSIRDARAGIGVKRYSSSAEMFAELDSKI